MYFYIVGLSLPAFGLLLISTSFFNGAQQGPASLKLTLMKCLGLTIPLAIAGAFIGLSAVWAGLALANILAALYADRILNQWLQDNGSELGGRVIWKDYVADFKHLLRMRRLQSPNRIVGVSRLSVPLYLVIKW